MKTRSLYLGIALALLTGAAHAQVDNRSSAEKITTTRVFSQPITWTSEQPPDESQSAALWQAIGSFEREGVKGGISALEAFIASNPQSPWTPSLRANLGKYYADRSRWTPALDHWEKTWTAARPVNTPGARAAADLALAHWLKLLGSLGRREKMGQLLHEARDRALGAPDQQNLLIAAQEAYAKMGHQPGIAYRCGTLAVANVGLKLKEGALDVRRLVETPSPAIGFSMSQLLQFADRENLGLVPMLREQGAEIVVPSVVHWKLDHYGAIVAREGNLYQVIDPTFEHPRWLPAETINAEASGYFMVHKGQAVRNGWRLMSVPETTGTRGKGYPPVFISTTDCNGNQIVLATGWPYNTGSTGYSGGGSGQTGSTGTGAGGGGAGGGGSGGGGGGGGGTGPCPTRQCGGGGGGSGGGGGGGGHGGPGGCSCEEGGATGTGGPGSSPPYVPPVLNAGFGMPVWNVSEPHISLWVKDTPVYYQTPLNGTVFFSVSYKQRQTKPYDTNIFGFGKVWHGNILSHLKVIDAQSNPNFQYYDATHYATDGAERRYLWSDSTVEFFSRTTMQRMTNGGGGLTGFKVIYVDGSVAEFTQLRSNLVGELEAFLSRNSDQTGKGVLTLNYETTNNLVRLTNVVDAAGGTNTFRYSTNKLWLVTEIENPFGGKANFAYDSSDYLTNITDMAGLASSFRYDSASWITNLVTPYGTNSFKHYTNSMGGGESFIVYRSCEITLPSGAKELYLYRDYQNAIKPADNPTQQMFQPAGGQPVAYSADSVYWGPLQYQQLSTTDVLNLTTNDYARGRHVLWNAAISGSVRFFDGTVEASRAPSPDGTTEGHKNFFTYASGQIGPRKVWYLLPDGTTNYVEYLRNATGHPTNTISTWQNSSGTLLTRTNQTVYAANGIDVVQVIDPAGHVAASYGYNTNHQVTSVTNAVGDVTTYTYNTNGLLTSVITPAGLTTTNLYDANGWLTQTVDIEISRTNTFTYTNGLVFSHVSECGLATTNRWDALGRLLSVTYPDGTTVSNVYDKLDVVAQKDRLGNWTYTGYNSMRQPLAVTNALGHVTRYTYCVCGSLEYVTNALGQVTTFFYDNAGRQTSVLLADGSVSSRSYNKLGQLMSVTDALNRSVTNYFNNQGLVTTVSNALGRLSLVQYDIEDHATNIVNASGISITITYDDLGRPLTRTYPDSGVEKFEYGAKGLLAYTNQLGKVTRYGYDVAGRKTAETNANSETILYTYSPSGELLTLTDGKNQVTTWQYDEYCRQTNKLDATSASVFQYKYDANGRLTNRWTPAKGHTYYAYDALGRQTNVDYAASTDIQMKYDALGRLTNMVDAAGITDYAFDSVGRLLSEDGPWADDTVTYGYHTNGLRASLTVALPTLGGVPWTQTYGYDVANRLTNITSAAGAFTYDYVSGTGYAQSLVRKLTLPGSSYITNSYDSVGRLLFTKLNSSSHSTLNSHAYVLNAGNQRMKQTFTDGNYTDYTYDDIGQLKTTLGSESGGGSRLHEQLGYAYDAAGNLQSRTNNALVQSFAVDSLNQLSNVTRTGTLTVAGKVGQGVPPISVTVNGNAASLYTDQMFAKAGFNLVDGTNSFTAIATDSTPSSVTNLVSTWLPATATFQYDSNGNMLSDGQWGRTYDDENQLVSEVLTNASKSEYVFDGKRRLRISRDYTWQGGAWMLTNEVRRIYDEMLVIQERNSSNTPQVTYTRGKDLSGGLTRAGGIGGMLGRSQHAAAGQPITHAYYHADGNGNVTMMVNAQQAVLADYDYDPYGNETGRSGTLADANLYRFSSKELRPNSGLYYYGYRFYAPKFQRWLNRDPIQERGGLNLNQFVNNNSCNYIDPHGLTGVSVCIPIAGGFACGDGPLPVGDAIGCLILIGAVIYDVCTNSNDPPKPVAIRVGCKIIPFPKPPPPKPPVRVCVRIHLEFDAGGYARCIYSCSPGLPWLFRAGPVCYKPIIFD